MKRVVRILVILSISTIASSLIAQETEKYYLDHESLILREGIYANIDMVNNNSPIPSTWIETDVDVNDHNFYKKITRDDEIIFFDDNGVGTLLTTKKIWGYSYNGDLHINVGGAFHRLHFVGRISHFFASKTTYYPNPLTKNYKLSYWSVNPFLITAKNKEYLVDIVENKMWEFDVEGLEQVLEKEPQLLNEFKALKKREQEYMKYIFLNRYNKKYPLDIPFD